MKTANKSKGAKEDRIKILAKTILDTSFELAALVGEVTVPKEAILDAVKKVFSEVDVSKAFSKFSGGRHGRVKGVSDKESYVRHAARYLLAQYTNMCLKDIGITTGSLNHTSSIRSVREAKKWIDTDEGFRSKVDNCKTLIRQYYYEHH